MAVRQTRASEAKSPNNLDRAREACEAARSRMEAVNSERSTLPQRVSDAIKKRNVLKSEVEELQALRRVHELAGDEFDAEHLRMAEANLQQAEADLAELKDGGSGFARALDVLRGRLDEKRQMLCEAIDQDTKNFRERALSLHSSGAQALRDAFAILELLDNGHFKADIPSVDGYPRNLLMHLEISPDVAAELNQLKPYVYERDISMMRILR